MGTGSRAEGFIWDQGIPLANWVALKMKRNTAWTVESLFEILEAVRHVARGETTVYFVITFLKPLSFRISLKFAELLPLPSRCLKISYGSQISSSTWQRYKRSFFSQALV
ncbi:hypothetical protein KC19_10G129400 [Ceratodon purpureus]|uniref:Uncharacterized protein n=1 Tax=Ceratodon purpureus TaxID=3225 RepID=A0A8T0GLB8_CERPU|nr:hypothetical protein KC19_10G129400 [Ceratodon purpureus]